MASHPTKIGKYNVEGVLGRGGMGVVYKAVDSQIGRYVAIKMITAGGDPSLLERFKSEARSTGSLQCPNIVTVYDFGEQDGNPYLVMQYLEGSSLESIIQKGVSLTLSEKLGIIIDVCNGLAYAHQRGVIHRDIKPGNIMVLRDGVNDGMAVIVDFGIARIGGDTRITRTDQIIGSVHYMSAEQLQSKELDNRTDVYATGVVLFQLLTGALPFDSPDTAATLLKIVNEQPPPLSTYIKEYPVELEEIVSRSLAKNREERYASAKDLAFDLTQVRDRLKSETVAQLLSRAEISLQREDFTRAREHLQQAQRIDRQNTKVQKMLSAVEERLRHLQRIEQARALRGQADEAYLEQRYDDALRLLEQAVALDGNNADLQVFRESVRSAKERAVGLRRALRRAEAALQDGDLDEAQNAVSEASQIDPQDTQANALKLVIAQQAEEKLRHEKVRKLLDEARNQITSRNLTAAFNILKNVETLDPASIELQTVLKLAMLAREQEKRRAETETLRRQIEAALRGEDFATAVAKANEGILRFPQEQSFAKLKALAEAQRQRVEQKTFIKEQFSRANSLADSEQLRQAVALLERALQSVPKSSELESLRTALLDRLATEEAELLKQREVEAVLAEGQRLLQETGTGDASRYLASKAKEYSDFQPFRELYDLVCARESLEILDAMLAKEPSPARQLQIAEDAWRQNPDNRWIQERVADLRQLTDHVNEVIKQARGFEAAGRLAETMKQWRYLIESYPHVPEFDAQVKRIANLLELRNTAQSATPEPGKPNQQAPAAASSSPSATEVLDSRPRARVEPPPEEDFPHTTVESLNSPPRRIEPPQNPIESSEESIPPRSESGGVLSGSRKYVIVAAVFVSFICVLYFVHFRSESVARRQPTGREIALQRESNRLKSSRAFDQAIEIDRKLQELGGALSDWGRNDVLQIEDLLSREKSLMEQAESAENSRQWDLAIQKYQDVINLHGTAESSATAAIEDVKLRQSGADANQVADGEFRRGVDAFDRKDYLLAEKAFEEVLRGAPQNWLKRAEARDFLSRSQHRSEQSGLLNDAEREFGAKHYDLARKLAGEVSDYPDGAPDIRSKGKELVREVLDRVQQQSILDEAVKQENINPALAETSFRKVIELPGGDPDLARRANEELAKLAKNTSVDTLIAAIQSSIKAGNFDAAEEKLRALNPSDPNYQRSRQSIDDAVFAKRVDEAESAIRAPESLDREAILRNLLTYFQAAAKLTNHNSRMASRYTQDIDAVLSPTRPPTGEGGSGTVGTSISPADKTAIQTLLSRYADIINRRRAKDLREVWPEIPKSQFDKYQSFIESHKKRSVSIKPEKWEPHGTGFLVTCQQILAFEQDGKLETHPEAINFYVVKLQDSWRISDIPASAAQ